MFISAGSVSPGLPGAQSTDPTKRRISTRAVKRKKFDDELVESSLAPSLPKIEKPKPKPTATATISSSSTSSLVSMVPPSAELKPPTTTAPLVVDTVEHIPVAPPISHPPPAEKKKPAKSSKRSKKASKVLDFVIAFR